jgi:hypothetical protein
MSVIAAMLGVLLCACSDATEGRGEAWRIGDNRHEGDGGDATESRLVDSAELAWEIGGGGDDRFLAVDLERPAECLLLHFWRPVGGSDGSSDYAVDVNEGWSLMSIRLTDSRCSNVDYDTTRGMEVSSAEGEVAFQDERPYVRSVDLRLVFPESEAAPRRGFRIVLNDSDVNVP